MQPRTHDVLHITLVQFLAELGELRRAARIRVREARGDRIFLIVHPHKRRGKRVQADAAHSPGELGPVTHQVQDCGQFLDHLVRVDHGGAVRGGGEGMRNLVPVATHRGSGGIVEGTTACRGAHVQGHDQRFHRVLEFNSELHRVIRARCVLVFGHDFSCSVAMGGSSSLWIRSAAAVGPTHATGARNRTERRRRTKI